MAFPDRSRSILLLITAIMVGGCAGPGPIEDSVPPASAAAATADPTRAGSSIATVPLVIYGVPALADVLGTVESAYEIGHPETDLILSLGSSAELRARIESGASVDLFLSDVAADQAALASAGLTLGDPVPLMANAASSGATPPMPYTAALVTTTPNQDAVIDFLAWFVGPAGRAIVLDAGFQPGT